MLLLLVDQQLFDPFSARRALELGPAMRIEAARAIGRAGDPRGRSVLEELSVDDNAEVRREAVFALGVLGDPLGAQALRRASRDPDSETGRLAVEGLAKLEIPLARVLEALEGLDPVEMWSRLTPALLRFPIETSLPVLRRALLEGGDNAYRDAMYVLARKGTADVLPILRELVGDPDPWLRGWAARALGRLGGGEDVARLEPLTNDRDAGVVIQALRSARRLVGAGAVAPPESWRPVLRRLMDDPRPGVRFAAIEAAGAWGRDGLTAELAERFDRSSGRDRELALLALAAAGDPGIAERAGRAAAGDSIALRRSAAAAAGLGGLDALLARLATDESPAVRTAAFAELLREETTSRPWAVEALADPDAVVRSLGFDWAAEHPVVSAAELLTALAGVGRSDVDAQSSAVAAIAARATAAEQERELVVPALELFAREGAERVAERAVEALEALGESVPPRAVADRHRGMEAYRRIAVRASEPRRVRFETAAGSFTIELDCPATPLTCVNFLQLVGQGFYDGLAFHRVIHDFVVQTGDPRGDGHGGPGYSIRDEIHHDRYERGSVGMALSGPDTGGSQFFIALSAQPHLDGGYTRFGEVVAGDDLLDSIEQGTVITRAFEIE